MIQEGYEVVVVDNLSTGRRENLNSRAQFREMDIRSKQIPSLLLEERPHYVFHFAAQVDVRKSMEDPLFDTEVNVLGTLNLIQASLKAEVRRFLFASTGGALYGEVTTRPFREEDPIRPLSAYGIAKYAGEMYLDCFSRTQGLPFVVLRLANVYGPRQDFRGEAGVVAIFCRQMLQGETPVLYGHGKMVRDYVYVGDVVEAALHALKAGENGIYNVGTGRPTTVGELFQYLKRLTGFSGEPLLADARPGEIVRSLLDASAIRSDLGWQPRVSLEEGLCLTAQWLRDSLGTPARDRGAEVQENTHTEVDSTLRFEDGDDREE